MSAENFYDDLNHQLAGEQFCLGEDDECPECGHPIRLHGGIYGCEFERGDAPGDGEHCAVAFPPCGCKHGLDRASTQQEVKDALTQEQILEASRSVRRGDFMLFAALRENGVM